ncbi:hypothetical protein [uncultured Gammaproteobacteria bacterium]|nr:hypothetical protein [uncultured Gammaproteobacteria bacterium]CAC9612236.1 hypothetical protein [uncultured Gammaproteobacteria bacterium]CAC9615915.1 hypothetical protein [uncultured Gammaproteobacteria bacterium]CAC9971589.1 hypothetical protein [uncultured Gammaproteobacteria bacterium]
MARCIKVESDGVTINSFNADMLINFTVVNVIAQSALTDGTLDEYILSYRSISCRLGNLYNQAQRKTFA